MSALMRLCVMLLLALGMAATRAQASPDAHFASALADVRAMVAAAPDAWGLSVSVTGREHQLLIATHGFADIDRRLPVTADTRFAIGSISKSFAAITLLQMADEGRFDPTAPISRYLPDFHPRSPFPPITGQALLTHTSGLPDYLSSTASMRFVIAALNDIEPGYAPGAHFWYSNSGYQLLGYAAERIDGMPYPLIVQRRVLDRLGMDATTAQIDDRVRPAIARSYVRGADGVLHEAPWFSYLAADGAIVSTAGDMGRYARMLLERGQTPSGRLISAQAFDRMATPVLSDYGYGIEAHDEGGILSHSGSIAGFQAYLHTDLKHGFAIVFLANGPLDHALRDRIIACLTEAAGGAVPESAKALPPFAATATFAGRFQGADGSSLMFEPDATGGLVLREKGVATPLTRMGRNIWGAYLTLHGPRTFVFFRDAAGTVTDVSEGSSSYAAGKPPASAPEAWRRLVGRYMAHGEEGPGVRIFARGPILMMTYSDSNAPPTPLADMGGGRFRLADPDWSPERLTFDTIIDGHAQRLTLNGTPLYRIDLP